MEASTLKVPGPEFETGAVLQAVTENCRRLAEIAHFCRDGAFAEMTLHEVEQLFDALKILIDSTDVESAARVLSDPGVAGFLPRVHRLRAQWESVAEQLLARKMLQNEASIVAEIDSYMIRNLPLTTIHANAFKELLGSRRHCLLVGCGAFPSTAFLLLEQTRLELTCLDRCAASCEHGARLVEAKYPGRADFRQLDAADLHGLEAWDVVFVSALAGIDWHHGEGNRRQMISSLLERARPGTLLLLRTAYALGRLVYPRVERDWFEGFTVTEIESPVIGRSSLLAVEI